VARSAESSQTRGGHRGVVNRRLVVFFEVSKEPPGGDTLVSTGIFLGNQHGELKRLDQTDATNLARRHFGDDEVTTLDCPVKDRPRMPCAVMLSPFRGRTDARRNSTRTAADST
jgi:hypothetical protein